MDQTGQQRTKIATKQPPTPPELADPPGRKVRGVFICRALRCGFSNVSYDDGEPKQCRNPKCSGEYVDAATKGAWLKCRDDSPVPEARPAEPIPENPQEPARVAAREPAAEVDGARGERTMSAEEYRGEWVAERVAERVAAEFDSGRFVGLPVSPEQVWGFAEALYDEGRKRGHLP